MVTTDPVDRDRVFVISFYLCDDSISVFERPQRNSGESVQTIAAPEQLPDHKSMSLMVNISFIKFTFHIQHLPKTDETEDVKSLDLLFQG